MRSTDPLQQIADAEQAYTVKKRAFLSMIATTIGLPIVSLGVFLLLAKLMNEPVALQVPHSCQEPRMIYIHMWLSSLFAATFSYYARRTGIAVQSGVLVAEGKCPYTAVRDPQMKCDTVEAPWRYWLGLSTNFVLIGSLGFITVFLQAALVFPQVVHFSF